LSCTTYCSINEYFEFEPQPDISIAYTPTEDTAKIYIILILISHNTAVESYGITAQDINAKISTNIGDIKNTPTFE
jgi:hypothetical protein